MAYAIGSCAGRLTFALVGACFIWMGSCETRASAQAADYPSQQIQVIVPFPAGGSADYFARSIFNRLSSVVGQPIVIENKAGAGGIIGSKAVIAAPPDGYTLLVSAVASVLVPPHLSAPPAFEALNDLTPITGIGTVPAVLVVRPSLGIKTFAEFLAYARANPGKLNLATSGAGTISHLATMPISCSPTPHSFWNTSRQESLFLSQWGHQSARLRCLMCPRRQNLAIPR